MKRTSLSWKVSVALALALALLSFAAAGCAHHGARELVYLKSGQELKLEDLDMKKQSLIIELHQGEVLPLEIAVEGDLFAFPADVSVPLTVKRDCLLRIDDRGLRISEDGRSFDKKPRAPGSFQLGFAVTKAGKRAIMRVKTPTR